MYTNPSPYPDTNNSDVKSCKEGTAAKMGSSVKEGKTNQTSEDVYDKCMKNISVENIIFLYSTKFTLA